MTYRLAHSLIVVRDEVNARFPNRDRSSDGWISDAAHAARGSASDHNPWVIDHNGIGVVRAYDFDSGPSGNTDIGVILAAQFTALGRAGHPPLNDHGAYVIWDHTIWTYATGWRAQRYTGIDPHVSHVHVSVALSENIYDSPVPWGVSAGNYSEGTDDMTPDQDRMLRELYNVFAKPYVKVKIDAGDMIIDTYNNVRTVLERVPPPAK